MARARKTLCPYCDAKLTAGRSFCQSCGQPTEWCSHEERVEWELNQWRAKNGNTGRSRRVRTSPVAASVVATAPRLDAELRTSAVPKRVGRPLRVVHEPNIKAVRTPEAPKRDIVPEPSAAPKRAIARRASEPMKPVVEPVVTIKPEEPQLPLRPASRGRKAAAAPTAASAPAADKASPKPKAAPKKNSPTATALLQEQVELLRSLNARLESIEARMATPRRRFGRGMG